MGVYTVLTKTLRRACQFLLPSCIPRPHDTKAVVPFWCRLRRVRWFKSSLSGVNAAAIGLVGAACVILYEGAVNTTADAMVFVFAGTLAMVYGLAAPLVVLAGGVFGAILHRDALNLGQIEWCAQGGGDF